MDKDSRAVESRERAVSSEPCSTRPNPFDEDDVSSRKRRRTSLTDSRSRSVDTVQSNPNDTLTGSLELQPGDRSAMKVDADRPGTPRSPERTAAPAPAEPRSSRVTLNLRSGATALDAIPSSPLSPAQELSPGPDEDIKASVEPAEMDVPVPKTAGPIDQEASSSTMSDDPTSPEIEIITVPDDDDMVTYGDADGIAIIREIRRDPTDDIPFRDPPGTPVDAILRIVQYLGNYPTVDEAIFNKMRDYIDGYLHYAKTASYVALYESFRDHRAIWHTFPDLIWALLPKKMPPAKTRDARQSVIDFYAAFAKLVAHWVHFDLHTLSRFRPDETIMPDLASPQYMNVFASLVRKGEVYASGYQQDGSDQVDVGEILDVFYMHLGGSMVPVMRMIQLQLDLLMRFPPMLNNLAFYSSLVDMAVQESARCLQASVSLGYGEHVLEQPRRQMVNGYHVFRKISEALSTMIDKHPSNVVPDALPSLLLHLSDVYCVVLQSQHMVPADAWTVLASDQGIPVESTLETPEDILKSHRERHPDIPAANAAEVISTHWRFDVYSRLILTGQMQVRVQGVTSMCSDLVQFWKKYSGEHADEFRNPPVLDYFARYLLRNDLINYILGPTCHPEITAESSNIIGFLVVTRTYSTEQTDRFWETLTSSQDPRVGEALMRMLARIANLFHPEPLLYICQKLETLPIEGFTPSMRDFCDSITKTLFAARHQTGEAMGPLESAPYELCLRLIRESSVTRPASPIAYPEIQNFAINKLKELMNGVSPAVHREIYMSCIQDVSSCSETTLGSLWGIFLAARNFLARELQVLAAEHGITKLLVDELEHAIATSHANGCGAVLTGTANQPRRELLAGIIRHQPATLTADLSRRLWDLLVGQGAACQDDRKTSWISINSIWRLSKDNPFLTTCFHEYLPSLPREFFCNGALDFIREAISPQLNDTGSNILEVPEGDVDSIGIEQLWRIILTATDQPVVDSAIHTLVNEVYIESPLILSFPHARHRAVHLALVGRCLKQLDQAARKLKSYVDGATSGDEEMVIVPSDGQVRDQEMIFVRSLAVLREFLRAHQLKSHFASPDLRSLMSQSPNTIEGDPADLKYQSFDGTSQTEVRPLKIGRRNTAASLLASIREATGFDNYRLYYRGQAFTPSESDICRSLDDLQIQSGLLLVKREDEAVATSPKSKPGASPLEIEIMGHFKQLWEYLSMEGKLAREIYGFLVKLPVDDSILEAFEDEGKSHEDIFPDGQPFKSLYAIHALRESLASRRRSSVLQSASPVSPGTENQTHEDAYVKLLSRAISLIVSAITDARVVDDCPNVELKIQVAFFLADCLVHFLKDPRLPPSAGKCLDSALLERLLAFVGLSSESPGLTHSAQLAIRSFEAMLESCLVSHSFWCLFKGDERLPDLLGSILIDDERQPVRIGVGKFMIAKCAACQGPSGVKPVAFAELFYPMILDLLQRLDSNSAHKCDEVLGAFHTVIKKLVECGSDVVDLADLVVFTGKLLLRHKSREDFSRPDLIDTAAHSLLQTLSYALQQCEDMGAIDQAAPRLWRSLFWTHFFPPTNEPGDSEPPVVPPLLLSMRCRHMLTEVLLLLTRYDRKEQHRLLLDLRQVLPFPDVGVDHEDAYVYDIPSPFDRTKALRSPCGYVGLRNLSNTCYFNSLFTQLYMNINFREFILNTDLHDGDNSQKLLFQTKLLFAHMQNSVRRFVDTSGCVSAITYEGAPIDIHNQMDVDEFCNVLFDHWETQLPSKQAAKQLRSFYSGELVSQIKSKECEHVSEKSEDFSAIQCDIKGKNNLLESLQAYVDGEIMDGDNKYKCSTCDKKVVAVKRTCLRNLPDNLIFHLKRFDFNLRTMQRSKINDHFSFPAQIDMQPYTADFLMDPSRKSTPDVFELVGVLVHSGTAESGHYYSYIRERPSTDGAETWVEFNDDVVTSWDPAQLESACFGGTDYRPPYDNSNGTVYDKTYSAYMLFYERSSSLRANQELLRRSGQPAPFKWDLEPEMARNIRLENRTLLRRHVLFDPTTIPFVCRNLVRLRERNDGECSRKHDNENLAVSVAINFLDQVATRAKDMPDFDMLLGHLKSLCKSCDRCCAALVRYLTERTEAFRFMVQRNAEPSVRSEVGSLLIFALDRVRRADPVAYGIRPLADEDNDDSDQGEPSDTMHMTERMLARLWNHFHGSIRSWQEAFGVMLEFAKLGLPETALLLSQDYLKRLLWLISADAALDLSPQFARMVTNINRRIATRPPSYESIIGLTHHLISALQPSIDENDVIFTSDVRLQMALEGRRSLPWSAEEVGLLTRTWARTGSNIFLEKLISIGQNTRATDAIIVRLVQLGDEMDNQIAVTLSQNISNLMGPHLNAPFLRAAALYCRFSNNVDRVSSMIQHVIINCRNLQHGEGMEFLDFLKTVFEMERRGTGETAHDIHLQGLANLPRWAPHLLGYFDRDVRLETSHFLDRVLLRHGPTPHFDEIHGGKERSNAMVRTAKQLGVACLVYLRDTYVMRRTNAVRDVVAPLLHVIDRCEKYFTGDDETDSDLEVEFAELSQFVIDALRRITVEEPDDMESDWDNNESAASSEQGESVGEMMAVSDLNDGDMQ